jgi:RNA polymerase sigma-70 factor (ECF subfamily)
MSGCEIQARGVSKGTPIRAAEGAMRVIDFDSLYEFHSGAVFRFALSLSGNRTMAEDITSETFIRVWTARERVDLATVAGYLITIARHLYLEQARGDRRREMLDRDWEDATPGPHALVEGRAELDAVLADLQTLAEPDRAALLMRAQEQMSYEEIAAALGISVSAAKVKVHRARRKVAQLRMNREEESL